MSAQVARIADCLQKGRFQANANPRMNQYPKPVTRNPNYERWRWQTFAVTWLAYAGFYLTRKGFSAAKIALGPGTAIDLSKGQMAAIDITAWPLR